MAEQAGQDDRPAGQGAIWPDFENAERSVFDTTPFIEEADLALPPPRPPRPPRPPAPQPAPVGDAERPWHSAVGERLLTPAEQAARERYFDAKAAAVARARRRSPSAAA